MGFFSRIFGNGSSDVSHNGGWTSSSRSDRDVEYPIEGRGDTVLESRGCNCKVDTDPPYEKVLCTNGQPTQIDVGVAMPGTMLERIKVGEFASGRPIRMWVAQGERLTNADIDKKIQIMNNSGWPNHHGRAHRTI